ncbi:MAG: hypothetical protein WB947_04315 [Thermoplasmata archaeon]
MSAMVSQPTIAAYAFVAIFGLIVLRRAYTLTHGTQVSEGRLLVLPALYILIYAGELAAIDYGAIGSSVANQVYISFGLDAVLFAVGVFVSYGYTLRHVQLYRAEGETAWSYRLNPLLPVVYVVLFFVRTAIEAAVLNLSPFAHPSATALAAISLFSLYTLFAIDAMWGLSTGFLIGRNAAVYHEWQEKLGPPASARGTALP